MLCLTRRPGESVFLRDKNGNAIAEIRLNSNRGNQISLGFLAGEEIDIVREELLSDEAVRLLREEISITEG